MAFDGQRESDDAVDGALEETFPASDPPANTVVTGVRVEVAPRLNSSFEITVKRAGRRSADARRVVHREMPKGDQIGRMHGFQLGANLPSALKMTAPRYQEVKAAEIPEITDDDGTHVRLVCGHCWGKTGFEELEQTFLKQDQEGWRANT